MAFGLLAAYLMMVGYRLKWQYVAPLVVMGVASLLLLVWLPWGLVALYFRFPTEARNVRVAIHWDHQEFRYQVSPDRCRLMFKAAIGQLDFYGSEEWEPIAGQSPPPSETKTLWFNPQSIRTGRYWSNGTSKVWVDEVSGMIYVQDGLEPW